MSYYETPRKIEIRQDIRERENARAWREFRRWIASELVTWTNFFALMLGFSFIWIFLTILGGIAER